MAEIIPTYELRLNSACPSISKQKVIHFLQEQGENSIVEGCIDNLDLDPCYSDSSLEDPFDVYGGDALPVSLFKFSRFELENLMERVKREFGSGIKSELIEHDTLAWQEGWKASFKPIFESGFVVFPPWEEPVLRSSDKTICIDPGMAFGTGQHETTRLSLRGIAQVSKQFGTTLASRSALDVGTGSGVLVIALAKSGFGDLTASDIDPDALIAARKNFEVNDVRARLFRGSVKQGEGTQTYSLVVANILGPILQKLFSDLVEAVSERGFLLLSGILIDELDEFKASAEKHGLSLVSREVMNGWGMLLFEK